MSLSSRTSTLARVPGVAKILLTVAFLAAVAAVGNLVPAAFSSPPAPALDARYNAAPPISWTIGETLTYTVQVTNTGQTTWSEAGSHPVHLSVTFGTASDVPGMGWAADERFGLPQDVPPGKSVALTVRVRPPASAGSYILRQRMVEENTAWFQQMVRTNVTVVPPVLAASYSSSPPTSWVGGVAQTYAVTVTNTGPRIWPAGGDHPFHLSVEFGGPSDKPGVGWIKEARFPLPHNVGPGESALIPVTIYPPGLPGKYVLRQRMVQENIAWFDQLQKTDVSVVPPSLSASYAVAPPASWKAGQTKAYRVKITNTGPQTWPATGPHPVHLSVEFGTASDVPAVGWATDQRSVIPADVPPGGSVSFLIYVTAPNKPGHYILRHRLVQESVEWFPQISKTDVTVTAH